jgi:hypothetical protein
MNGVRNAGVSRLPPPLPHTDASLRHIPSATFALVTQVTAFSCTAQLKSPPFDETTT